MTEFLAILALLASVSANGIAERARRSAARSEARSKAMSRAEKRTEMLVELELQNAAVGNMLFITARKILLFRDHPALEDKYPKEVDRLIGNLELLQEMRGKEAIQTQLAEQAYTEEENIALQAQALADVRRLRVRIESDTSRESEMLEELLREISSERA